MKTDVIEKIEKLERLENILDLMNNHIISNWKRQDLINDINNLLKEINNDILDINILIRNEVK